MADPAELWTVDHLVTPLMTSATGRVTRVEFDYPAANSEIGRRGGKWEAPREAWAAASSPSSVPMGAQMPPHQMAQFQLQQQQQQQQQQQASIAAANPMDMSRS